MIVLPIELLKLDYVDESHSLYACAIAFDNPVLFLKQQEYCQYLSCTCGITDNKTQVSEDDSIIFLFWKDDVHSGVFVETEEMKLNCYTSDLQIKLNNAEC